MNTKFNINFSIDEERLGFFSTFYNIRIRKKEIFEDAHRNLRRIEKIWDRGKPLIDELFSRIFKKNLNNKIEVNIFPSYIYLGTVETRRQTILFGQPLRTNNFSSAIIAHEIGHIFLSKIEKKRPVIIDEIICFMIEDYIYSTLDNKSLLKVWREEELDLFHLRAMEIAMKEIKIHGSILNRSIDKIIEFLPKTLDKDTFNIKPAKGLLKNLSSNTKNPFYCDLCLVL